MRLGSASHAAAVVLALLAAGCGFADAPDEEDGQAAPTGAVHLLDATGTTVTLPAPARRIVSLVPSATETLHALGRDDVLVGRTDFDTQPWAAALPSVGGGLGPNVEAIVALAPDLVVRFAGEQDTRTPARLVELGIPVLSVRPDRIGDIYRTVELLGEAIGDRPAADSLGRAIRVGLAEAAEKARALPRRRVAYVLGGTPPWVAGPGTYIDELVSLMGGDNVFGDLGLPYAAVSPEELRARRIDVVLVSGASGLDAGLVPGARIEQVESSLEIPGPGVVESAHLLAERIHGRRLE
jgi:ABC-type Fe3+-hydroxamate transport system substrate-binding protein